jgi:SHS2 domain-containing protein
LPAIQYHGDTGNDNGHECACVFFVIHYTYMIYISTIRHKSERKMEERERERDFLVDWGRRLRSKSDSHYFILSKIRSLVAFLVKFNFFFILHKYQEISFRIF